MATKQPRERDFMEELERQRTETKGPEEDGRADEAAAALTPVMERSVGVVPAPTKRAAYDADDLEIPSFLRRK